MFKKISQKDLINAIKCHTNFEIKIIDDPEKEFSCVIKADIKENDGDGMTLNKLAKIVENLAIKVDEGFSQINTKLDGFEQRLDGFEQRLDNLEQKVEAILECPTIKKEIKK